jgi:histidinol-phosphate aminotransferase
MSWVARVEYGAAVSDETVGRPRPLIAALPAYRPGKGAAQAEAEHGITDAIKLASNENPDEPLDPIVAAVAAAAHGVNRYPDHRATDVREAIGAWLGVGAEHIAIGTGSSGLLQQFVLAYVDPGEEVLFPWRSFEAYPIFTDLVGGRSVTVPLADDLGYDADALIEAITPLTKLLFLATPNNPTGVATSTAALSAIVERVPSDVVVVVDEAYREFVDPSFGDPVVELLPRFPNVVVTRTFSKAHGLAGLRLGYAVGDPRVIATVDKTLLPFAVNSLAQAAALAAIANEEAITARVRGIVRERIRVEHALATAGWKLPDHQGNFVWLRTGEASDEVGLGLERRGVVVRPFSGDGIRVTIGTPAENDRFLAALADVVGSNVPNR